MKKEFSTLGENSEKMHASLIMVVSKNQNMKLTPINAKIYHPKINLKNSVNTATEKDT